MQTPAVRQKHATLVAAVLTALAVGGLVVWELVTAGADPNDWDYLFASGFLTALGGLWLARGHRDRFAAMFERLENRAALHAEPPLTPKVAAELRDSLRDRAERWSLGAGVFLAVATPLVWIVSNVRDEKDLRLFDDIAGPVVGCLGGFLVGRVLGRMVAYGLLGPFLARRGVTFRATPGHVDGAAGLKPVGDYFLSQALLLAVPAVFLLAWSLLFQLPDLERRYQTWRATYLVLLAVVIVIELAAFVFPMWHAHVEMKQAKRDALVDADKVLARDIAEVEARLEGELSADERAAAQDRLERLKARYDAIETMPTWPVDRALRRRVTLGHAGLVVGLVGQVAAVAGWS